MRRKFARTNNLSKIAIKMVGDRTFTACWSQNLLMVTATIIVIVLITATCSVFYNLQKYRSIQDLKDKGTMTDIVLSVPNEIQIRALNESDIVQKPLYVSYKMGRLVGNEGQSGLTIYMYAEENWDVWGKPLFSDIQGKYPVKENEVMMSTWLLRRMRIEPVIGSEITLSVAWEDMDIAQPEKFILSGYYTDTSYIDTASSQKILLSTEMLVQHEVQAEMVGFSLTSGQFWKKFDLVQEQLEVEEGQTLLLLKAQGILLSSKDMGIALAIILFFMLDGFLIIYNINIISITKDIQFYGLLKTIGTSPKQMRQLMYSRMRKILLLALPVGLLLGCLITQWIVPMIIGSMLDGFLRVEFHLIIPFVSTLFSSVMIFISFYMTDRKVCAISPIAALRYTGSNVKKKTSRLNYHVKLRYMGLKNIFRQPQKAYFVIGTFFLSSVAFLLCMTVLGGMSLDEYINYNTANDISLYNSMSRASFAQQEEQSFTPELVKELQNLECVESFHMTKVVPIYEHYSDEVYDDWLKIKNEFETLNGIESSDTGIWKENPKATFWGLLIGIDSDLITDYNRSAQIPIDLKRFEKGEFLLTTDMNGNGLHMGSVITFSVMDTDQQFKLPIGGQIGFARDGMNSGPAPWLIVSNNVIDRYRENAIIYSIKIDSIPAYEESVLEQVVELTDDIPAISRTSKIELAESLENAKNSLSKMSAFLAVVLFTVGIMNFINAMSISILSKQKELATIEAVGASKKQVLILIVWEGFWYFLFTFVLSVTLGSVADFIIFHMIRENLGFGTFRYPVLQMLLYMLLSLLLCTVIPIAIYKKMSIHSIVERLREN